MTKDVQGKKIEKVLDIKKDYQRQRHLFWSFKVF